jgi:hypothetical protein
MPTDEEPEGRRGLETIVAEVDELRDIAREAVRAACLEFFAVYEAEQDPRRLAGWLVPRCWREIEYTFMLNEEIRRYGLSFERKHVVALARHALQEAEHYEMVGRLIERFGGTVPVSVPETVQPWSDYLWACLDRHPLAAIAAWYVSETSASGTFESTLAAAERYGYDEMLKIYRQVVKDEEFHLGLGRLLLNRYVETDDDRDEVLRSMRGMTALVADSYWAAVPTG